MALSGRLSFFLPLPECLDPWYLDSLVGEISEDAICLP